MSDPVTPAIEFELRGDWWQPAPNVADDPGTSEPDTGDDPTLKPKKDEPKEPSPTAGGPLSYSPADGLRLETFNWPGKTDLGNWFDSVGDERLPIVHGQTVEGHLCTLFDVSPNGSTALAGGGSAEWWRPTRLFHGAHFDAEPRFRRASIRIRGLREWMLSPPHVAPSEGKTFLKGRTSVEVELDGVKLTLSRGEKKLKDEWREHREFFAEAWFDFEEMIGFAEFKERYAQPLHNLILFANREQARYERVTLYYKTPAERAEKWWGPEDERVSEIPSRPHLVDVVDQEGLGLPKNPNPSFSHPLFRARALGTDTPDLIKRWFELRWKLEGAADVFFWSLDQRSIHLETQLLNLLAFAEAFHRKLHDDPVVPRNEHEQLIPIMTNALPDRDRAKHYKQRLIYAGDQTLRHRLRFLFNRAADVTDRAKDWFKIEGQALVNTRNYFTHWDKKKDDEVLEGAALWEAINRLTVVLEINYMLDLGMDPDLIKRCVETTYAGHTAIKTLAKS
ncbi:MAG TPA: HEPN domain-containing protein [Solirubrobacterales bacterium]|nr:HEPN domain-containing protein [Solirubrobacterales bacterium]